MLIGIIRAPILLQYLIVMIFVKISGASSIRDALVDLACIGGGIEHLGIASYI
jgi:hypothetical protein